MAWDPGVDPYVEMLHVRRVAETGVAYYLSERADELVAAPEGVAGGDGAAGDGAAGYWVGHAAHRWRLDGPVEPQRFAAVLAGCHPVSGAPWPGRRRVPAFDLTFSAPKSVSILFALGEPRTSAAVLVAHRAAVDAATGYVERRAVAARRSERGERRLVAVGGIAGAAFDHALSRGLDPHLHTHVVVANAVRSGDGRWSSIDGRGLFAHALTAGRLYDAHLRHGLARTLGVGWARRGAGRYEVAGVDPLLVGELSSRRAAIRQHLAERGHHSSRAGHVAWAATRDPKVSAGARRRLPGRWRDRADALGAGIGGLRATARPSATVRRLDEHVFGALLVTSPHAVATRRSIVGAWAGAAREGATVTEVEQAADWLLGPGDQGIGVGEPPRPVAGLTLPTYLAATLGSRPLAGPDLDVWREAAGVVGRYRSRWGVVDRSAALGVHEDGVAGMPARRLADHLTVLRAVDHARRRLGDDRSREVDRRDRGLGR